MLGPGPQVGKRVMEGSAGVAVGELVAVAVAVGVWVAVAVGVMVGVAVVVGVTVAVAVMDGVGVGSSGSGCPQESSQPANSSSSHSSGDKP